MPGISKACRNSSCPTTVPASAGQLFRKDEKPVAPGWKCYNSQSRPLFNVFYAPLPFGARSFFIYCSCDRSAARTAGIPGSRIWCI